MTKSPYHLNLIAPYPLQSTLLQSSLSFSLCLSVSLSLILLFWPTLTSIHLSFFIFCFSNHCSGYLSIGLLLRSLSCVPSFLGLLLLFPLIVHAGSLCSVSAIIQWRGWKGNLTFYSSMHFLRGSKVIEYGADMKKSETQENIMFVMHYSFILHYSVQKWPHFSVECSL